MSDSIIENRLTPLDPADAGAVMWKALSKVLKETDCTIAPSQRAPALAVFMAHSAHETGHWHKMHCFNFANIKAGIKYRGPRCEFRAWEILLGKRVVRVAHWRAFESAEAGALDYMRFLGSDTDGGGNRYQAAWDEALCGNAAGFAKKLKMAGFFTDKLENYQRSLSMLSVGFLRIATEVSADA